MREYSSIIKPVITEKSAILSEQNKYTFVVNSRSNKVEVKKAFELLYGTEAKVVRIINTQPKSTVRRGIKKRSFKKAIITIEKGKTIDLSKIK